MVQRTKVGEKREIIVAWQDIEKKTNTIDHFDISELRKTTALVTALGSELLVWPVQQEQNQEIANKMEIDLFLGQ